MLPCMQNHNHQKSCKRSAHTLPEQIEVSLGLELFGLAPRYPCFDPNAAAKPVTRQPTTPNRSSMLAHLSTHISSLGMNLRTFSLRPDSSLSLNCWMAASASWALEKVTMPQPRLRPSGLLSTLANSTWGGEEAGRGGGQRMDRHDAAASANLHQSVLAGAAPLRACMAGDQEQHDLCPRTLPQDLPSQHLSPAYSSTHQPAHPVPATAHTLSPGLQSQSSPSSPSRSSGTTGC